MADMNFSWLLPPYACLQPRPALLDCQSSQARRCRPRSGNMREKVDQELSFAPE